ncbi:MAG: hypothetical protein E6J90_22345 [Deltaproteobacteria bacterium]|nr:MAG: hypothetical protein E6J91_46530 [Deltaproteobacteria bacterium]TMQ17463.1 MAG: hypothetical protein E6J90_22345 [Deltaproteobacteria bacterium]
MNDDAPRTPGAGTLELNPADFMTGNASEDAIAEVVRLILELTSSNEALDYANSARIRVEQENAVQEAQHTFEAMPGGPARVRALRRLDGLRIAAERQLKMAPTSEPSASVREVDEWKARRQGQGAGPPRPLRRPHSDTRPETPGAMPAEARDTDRDVSHAAPVVVVLADSGPEKEHR